MKKYCSFFIMGLFWMGAMGWLVPTAAARMSDAREDHIQAWNVDEKIHPDLKANFEKRHATRLMDKIDLIRRHMMPDPQTLPMDAAVTVRNVTITRAENIPPLRVRIYEPKQGAAKALPALLWLHGGGYVFGTPESNEAMYLRIVKQSHCRVVVPDYRLAPEHPYPAAIDDGYATLLWMLQGSLQIDRNRIAVGGDSAGGGLAAAIALRARDEQGPKICFQMLLYPMLDDRNESMSSYQIVDGRMWNREANIDAWKLYLSDENGAAPPYAAPSRATDLSGLPPAYIMVGSLDVFRDENLDYAARLLQSGVPVELHVYPGAYHAFDTTDPSAALSQRAQEEYLEAIEKAFN